MGDWELADGQRIETAGVVSASSTGVIITGSGSANTKGSWTELIASTAFDGSALIVNLRTPTAGVDMLVDIGIGASGSEVVLIPNAKADNGSGGAVRASQTIWPIAVPAGSRLSARLQATTGSSTCRAQVLLLGQGFAGSTPAARVTDYGINTADSGGVSIDPGGTANTKGSYAQIVASTTNPIKYLVLGFGNAVNTTRVATGWLVDVAVGAGGSETIVIGDLHVEASASEDTPLPTMFGAFPLSVPTGTRIAVRAACSITDATDRLVDFCCWGVG